ASLIRTSARLGAIAGDAEPAVVEALSTWAWELGMVFQIADDALDLVADEETIGKPAGSDIREGTFTQAVLEAAEGPDGARIRLLLDRPRPFPDTSVEEVIHLVRTGGFVDRALDGATARLEVADRALEILPSSEARQVLSSLGDYLVTRVQSAR
ncbi:MAG: polyprenyl synthetase family protein, partial [Acidimicrobiia bacterium]